MGKPVRVNLAREVEGAVDKLRFFAGAARLLEGRVTGIDGVGDLGHGRCRSRRASRPSSFRGTTRSIWPCASSARALAAGCTTVVKSSEITPASTAALIEAVHECGVFPRRRGQSGERPGRARPAMRWSIIPASTRSPSPAARRPACASWSAPPSASRKVSLECGGKFPAHHLRRRRSRALPRCGDLRRLHVWRAVLHRLHAARRRPARLRPGGGGHRRTLEKTCPSGDPLDPNDAGRPDGLAQAVRQGDRATSGSGSRKAAARSSAAIPKRLHLAIPAAHGLWSICRRTAAWRGRRSSGRCSLIHRVDSEQRGARDRQQHALRPRRLDLVAGHQPGAGAGAPPRCGRHLDQHPLHPACRDLVRRTASFGHRPRARHGRASRNISRWKRLCIDTRREFHLKSWFEGRRSEQGDGRRHRAGRRHRRRGHGIFPGAARTAASCWLRRGAGLGRLRPQSRISVAAYPQGRDPDGAGTGGPAGWPTTLREELDGFELRPCGGMIYFYRRATAAAVPELRRRAPRAGLPPGADRRQSRRASIARRSSERVVGASWNPAGCASEHRQAGGRPWWPAAKRKGAELRSAARVEKLAIAGRALRRCRDRQARLSPPARWCSRPVPGRRSSWHRPALTCRSRPCACR